MTLRSQGVRVRKSEAEKVRKKLIEEGKIDTELRISKDGDYVIIPVKDGLEGYDTVIWDFEEKEKRLRYQDIADIPEELKEHLPTSFDIIGDVLMIKIPDEMMDYRKQIGEAILKALPSIRVVAMDRGVKGEYRTRDLEIIAGSGPTETIHTEYGIRLKVDPARAYFSPRLANEHRRIAELVRDGEEIIDMFAGVGPFSIMIAKMKKVHIYAIDLNPDAIRYLEENIRLNNVSGIEPINADARFIVRSLTADRVIMNLPHSALHFFEDALSAVDDGWIHYYEIIDDDKAKERINELKAMGEDVGKDVSLENLIRIRNYAPGMGHYVWDLRVKEE